MKIKPFFSEFRAMAGQGNLIAMHCQLPMGRETPVSAYLKVRDGSFSYLLESTEDFKQWGRYSLVGYKPLLTTIFREGEMEIAKGKERETLKTTENPLHILRDLTGKFKPVQAGNLPPFWGGLVGYLNYGLVGRWEHLPGIFPEHTHTPESIFVLASRMIIFDHLTRKIAVVAFAHFEGDQDLKEIHRLTSEAVEEVVDKLQGPLPPVTEENSISISGLRPDFTRQDFERAVQKAKRYIVSGEVIQVVLSQRFSGRVAGDDFALYRSLRKINPSPYMFYLCFGEIRLAGSSPEVLVRLAGRKAELCPIAGTRPRGKTCEEDMALEKELTSDPKERAEHIMLVDLGRNDLGKVAVPGSIRVSRLMEVERYSHVMHIVSHAEGELRPGCDAFDLVMAAFPAGTVTGAPKIRAMEIISELEASQRGPYAGAVGYFGLNGEMDFCITIRTFSIEQDRLWFQAGAGIVADSSPEREYEEILRKAAVMFEAVDMAKGTGSGT